MNQIEAKLGSYWLKVNKIKHVSASYTGKIQMLCEINMQVGDRGFSLTDVVTDLLILLAQCLKHRSYYTLQPSTFGNHFIDYQAAILQAFSK